MDQYNLFPLTLSFLPQTYLTLSNPFPLIFLTHNLRFLFWLFALLFNIITLYLFDCMLFFSFLFEFSLPSLLVSRNPYQNISLLKYLWLFGVIDAEFRKHNLILIFGQSPF